MEKQFIYISHKIEGEESLPKVEGEYIVFIKPELVNKDFNSDKTIIQYRIYDKKEWIRRYAFWLEEVPVPTDEEIKEEASYRNHNWGNGIYWFKSKLGLK